MTERRKHNHYFKNVEHLKEIDVYRVLSLFNVTDPCIAHAVKKLLVAGGRGAGKDAERDVREAVDSLNRFLQMIAEDCNAGTVTASTTRHEPVTVEVKHTPFVLDPTQVRLDSYRASRQPEGDVYAGVRATHVPTGLSVGVESTPYMDVNKADAMRLLATVVVDMFTKETRASNGN